jgi:hypothetical protein
MEEESYDRQEGRRSIVGSDESKKVMITDQVYHV